jgi:TonB family protein
VPVAKASPDLAAPPAVAPPAVDVPAFAFEGGKAVQSVSDPRELYKGSVEFALRSNWNRPNDMEDEAFTAEIEISVDRTGKLGSPEWKKGSGNSRWDDSVRKAIAATKAVSRPPPTNFPGRVLVRFDVETREAEEALPQSIQ